MPSENSNKAAVFTSQLQRARRTCELAGFRAVATIDRNLLQWKYSDYEGRRTAEIHMNRPGWELSPEFFRGGGGASSGSITADRTCQAR